MRDYEVLRNELPGDAKVAEALLQAQVSLKTLRGTDTSNMKFGGQVEVITGLDPFHAAITLPGNLSFLLVSENYLFIAMFLLLNHSLTII